jgi:hypothetical protein
MTETQLWPIVQVDDDGIRPAGQPDQCFYCRSRVGEPHGLQCVIVQKTVRVRYTFEIDVQVPHHWTKEQFEFHRNDSTWCADNGLDDLRENIVQERISDRATVGTCLCEGFHAEWLGVTDDTPRALTRPQAKERNNRRSPESED